MAGRTPKPPAQIAFEKGVAKRLRQIRKDQFPEDGEIESRRRFAEGAGLSETAYEKMEQRGALHGFAIATICVAYGINPFELLGIPSIGEQISTSSARIALINERLSEAHRKELLRVALQLPTAPIVSTPKNKKTTSSA